MPSSEISDRKAPSRPANTYAYSAYGLVLHSAFALPELEPASRGTTPDVYIHQRSIDHPLPDDETERGCYEATGDEAFVWYKEVGQLHIRNGQEIIIDPIDDGEERLRHHILQGMALGILLHQRGHLTLHASGVEIDGRAVAFVGFKRMGKSTTAATMYAAGHRLLTDDTIVLDPEGSGMVLPGFSQVRLDPEAVAASLGLDPEDVPRLHARYHKRTGKADRDFDLTPLPLACIFSLNWGDDFTFERLVGREAFIELVTHSYAQRFLGNVGATPRHFAQINEVVASVPILSFTKPRALDRLPELVDQVRATVRSL